MNKTKGFLFTAGIMLATAFTLSCEEKNADKPSATVADTGGTVAAVPKTAAPAVAETPNPFNDNRDGKKYKTVKIGEQVWMAENLNYKAEGSKCYDNKPANCEKYGRLYNWETAKTVCPSGWHLPSMAEWEVLIAYIGGAYTEGYKLKSKSGWDGTDEFGFSALPGGYGPSDGNFDGVGYDGYWWQANTTYPAIGIYWGMGCPGGGECSDDIGGSISGPELYSVRCVRD